MIYLSINMHIALLLGELGVYITAVIVCCYSNAKQMPTDVTEALKTVVMTQGKLSQPATDKLFKDLESCKHLQLEVWN